MNAALTVDQTLVDVLNRHCHCIGTDVPALQAELDRQLHAAGWPQSLVITHSHLFAHSPVFIEGEYITQMQRVIDAIESVVALPAYQSWVIANTPSLKALPPKPRGVFFGYDFHIAASDQGASKNGPQLIEVNTNAGGALLNVAMMRAQQACCPEVLEYLRTQPDADALQNQFVQMFMDEWQLARGSQTLNCIAIVDEAPEQQYLYPEFLLFKSLFESRGIRTVIVDPSQLQYREHALWFQNERIDLVYNRLTDFFLSDERSAALCQAYENDATVITPHPHAYALYANKLNLTLLSDASALRQWGVNEPVIAVLQQSIPVTRVVKTDDADQWWQERKQWFFKPINGFGGRGSYRGDKLTRKVFAEILQGDYIAQMCVLPSQRHLNATDAVHKYDVRCYAYAGNIQLLSARLYQGQTTNFRTEGGGFAPIYKIGLGHLSSMVC